VTIAAVAAEGRRRSARRRGRPAVAAVGVGVEPHGLRPAHPAAGAGGTGQTVERRLLVTGAAVRLLGQLGFGQRATR
jgi:hypothetical protein